MKQDSFHAEEDHEECPEKEASFQFHVSGHSIKSPMHGNEDRLIIHHDDEKDSNLQVYVSIDGHGGDEASEYVHANFISILDEEMRTRGLLDDNEKTIVVNEWTQMLHDVFMKLDLRFCKWAKRRKVESGACVCALLIVQHKMAFVANVGDCRTIVIPSSTSSPSRKANKVKALSVDHKASHPAEMKRIQAAGGIVMHGRIDGVLEPSRAIGDLDIKTPEKKGQLIAIPEIKQYEIVGGETFIVATDGVWDVVTNARLAVQLSAWEEAEIAQEIVELARDMGSMDDISAIVVTVSAQKS